MKQNVIKFLPDGSVQHTLKDSFFDTRFLGKREVYRMSEIVFNEEKQKFFIYFDEKIKKFNGGWRQYQEMGMVVYFDTYEAAVEKEIELINEYRKKGLVF
jgi:hypothetical protein